MRFMADLGMPQSPALENAARFTLAGDLQHAIERDPWKPDEIFSILEEAREDQIQLNAPALERGIGN
jgi:hypothetical protein